MGKVDSAPGLEKAAQEIAAFILEDACSHLDRVVEMLGIGKMEVGVNRTGFGIGRPEDKFLDAGMDHGPYAHDTRFDGDDQN